MKRVWQLTFSPIGFGVAASLGCIAGAVRNALTPSPKRCIDTWDDELYQVSDQEWVLEGMWYGALAGTALNITWPVLLVGGTPLALIYYGARTLQEKRKDGGL